jgi:hypothetical protein
VLKLRFLSPGNSKLGPVYNFSIPAYYSTTNGVVTCPGATPWCREHCYARRGRFRFGHARAKHVKNLRRTLRPTFVKEMLSDLEKLPEGTVVRVHTAGDFYSVDYIDKWIEIAESARHVRFYAYTRSWRVSELKEELEELIRMPNWSMLASTDPYTGEPPDDWIRYGVKEAGIEKCYRSELYGEPSVKCPGKGCYKCRKCFNPVAHVRLSEN